MHTKHKLKHRIHHMLQDQHMVESWTAFFNFGLASLILMNVLALMLETVSSLYNKWEIYFIAFELLSAAIFATEYLLRLWVADLNPKYQHPLRGRIRYLFSPMALIDLVAFLPSLFLLNGLDLRFLRMLRLFRVVRLFHVPAFNKAIYTIWHAAYIKKAEFFIAGAIMFVLLIIGTSLAYFAEHEAQPQAFSSIPASLWWGIMTMTTVGYGDVYPVTAMGKIIAAILATLGIGFFALPSAILASSMIEQFRLREQVQVCPHCGEKLP